MGYYQINGEDVTNVIACNPNFLSKLDDTSKFKTFSQFFGDFGSNFAKKITGIGWGTAYSNFPYKMLDNTGNNVTPEFLTAESCPYQKRNMEGDPASSWGDVRLGPGSYTMHYESGYIYIYSGGTRLYSKARSNKLVFIDICGGGGGGGPMHFGLDNKPGGGGGGGASAFVAVNLSNAISISVGEAGGKNGGGGGSSSLTDGSYTITCGGGKGADGKSGGGGGSCSGNLWVDNKFAPNGAFLKGVGYHGKGGGDGKEGSKSLTSNPGGSFKPTSGSDYIPNFDVISNLTIGISSDGTHNSWIGRGAEERTFNSEKKMFLGGGGGACAMGMCFGTGSSGGGGSGGEYIETLNLLKDDGYAGGKGLCVIHW